MILFFMDAYIAKIYSKVQLNFLKAQLICVDLYLGRLLMLQTLTKFWTGLGYNPESSNETIALSPQCLSNYYITTAASQLLWLAAKKATFLNFQGFKLQLKLIF